MYLVKIVRTAVVRRRSEGYTTDIGYCTGYTVSYYRDYDSAYAHMITLSKSLPTYRSAIVVEQTYTPRLPLLAGRDGCYEG